MLRSMTGFGAASRDDGPHALRVEVRSVNHRHLLVKTRLTSEFAFLEGEVEALVKKRLERGSISVHLASERGRDGVEAKLAPEVALRYRNQIRRLAKELDLAPEVSMDTLLALPGVVVAGESSAADSKGLPKFLLAAIDEALGRLIEMRETEGAAIESDLRKHAAATAKLVARIEKRMPTVVRTHQKHLERRVSELLDKGSAVSAADLAREVALLADRLDVSEEIARLKSHLAQLDAFLEKGGRIGRKLDFLVQEIFREINTIGSKCSDSKVAHWVVEAKTHAERLREQVQNVE